MTTNSNGTAVKSNLKNQSELAEMFNLDRTTVATYLKKAGIEPHESSTHRNKKYIVTAHVESVLRNSAFDPSKAARAKKTEVETQLKQMDLEERLGTLAPVSEFADTTTKIWGVLFKLFANKLPKELSKKVRRAASDEEGARILKAALTKPLYDLSENHQDFINK